MREVKILEKAKLSQMIARQRDMQLYLIILILKLQA